MIVSLGKEFLFKIVNFLFLGVLDNFNFNSLNGFEIFFDILKKYGIVLN